MRRKRIPKNLSPLLSSSSPARPSPLSPPSLPVRVDRSRLALSSFPPTDSLFLPASYKDAANLFILTSRDGMPRSGERERRRLQPASNAAEVACAPSPPKIPIPLVSLSVVALARRNAAENRRSPPSTTPRWQTLRPPPDSLSNILARCDRVKRVKARQSCTIIEDRIVISWQRHPHSSDILFAIFFFFFRRRKRFAFLERTLTLLFSLSCRLRAPRNIIILLRKQNKRKAIAWSAERSSKENTLRACVRYEQRSNSFQTKAKINSARDL